MEIPGLIFLPFVIWFAIWNALDTIKRQKNGTDNGTYPLVNSIFLAGIALWGFIASLLKVLE